MKNSPHIGFARKHRPKSFDEVVGQEAVSQTLRNAVESERPAHAYLFFGPRGVGKTTSARLLAKALNCVKGPAAESCGKCPSCEEITKGSSIDVLELDAASNTQVDKIREMIIETVALAPSRDRYKIFIIDEVHMLSTSSFNALLKTLEEPPPHVLFVLATTELSKIPATIVSRCQRFRFRPVPLDLLSDHLGGLAKKEKLKVEKSALALLARASAGSVRDGVSLLEQAAAFGEGAVTEASATELMGTLPTEFLIGILSALLDQDAKSLSEWLAKVAADGFDSSQLLRDLRDRLQELYLSRLGVSVDLGKDWIALAADRSPETFSFMLRRVNKTLTDMRFADSPQLAFELGVYGMLESAHDLGPWVARLEALESRLSQGGADLPAPREAMRLDPTPAPVKGVVAAPKKIVEQKTAAIKSAGPPPADENMWPAVVERLKADSPSLAGSLIGCRLLSAVGGEWTLIFKKKFDLERAQGQKTALSDLVSEVTGKKVSLKFEMEAKSSKSSKSKKRSSSSDLPDMDDEPTDAGVQKVMGVFEGKIRKVKRNT